MVIEAGTGVGKSFAYLVPAILAATEPCATRTQPPLRVVISTHTISLQEQLITKDLPLLTAVIPVRVLGRAGQGPRQLPQPAAAGAGRAARQQPVCPDERICRSCSELREWAAETATAR